MGNQLHMRRRTARCVALAAPQVDVRQTFLVMGGCLIASAIIASWLTYLPNGVGATLSPLDSPPQDLSDNSVNRLHKGDRILRGDGESFDVRWSAIATIRKPASLPTRTELAAVDMHVDSRGAY